MAATCASPAIARLAMRLALAQELALFTSSGRPSQAKENWQAWWLLLPSVGCIVGAMILINYVGEGLQDAFDLKRSR